jgi:uncharacterized Zn finger protein
MKAQKAPIAMQCPKCSITPLPVQSRRTITDDGALLIIYCRNCGYPIGVLRDDKAPPAQ